MTYRNAHFLAWSLLFIGIIGMLSLTVPPIIYAEHPGEEDFGPVAILEGRNCHSTKLMRLSMDAVIGQDVIASTDTVTDTDEPVEQNAPSLVAGADGSFFVAWAGYNRRGGNIFFSRSTDGGLTWERKVRVNSISGSADLQATPGLAIGGEGTLYVSWVDHRNDKAEIFFARSNNQGLSWSVNVRVSNEDTGAGQYAPSLAVGQSTTSSDVLYIAWEDHSGSLPNIRMARSTNQGRTWSSSSAIASDPDDAAEGPQLTVGENGMVYCVWCQLSDEAYSIAFSRSTDYGKHWNDTVTINDNNASAETPVLALGNDGNLYAAWADYRNEDTDIFMSSSTDGGETWSANVRVNNDPGTADQSLPILRTGSLTDTVYLAWHDQRNGESEIYFARSLNGGQTWTPNVEVSNSSSTTEDDTLSLVVSQDHQLAMAWSGTSSDEQSAIYTSSSLDDGQTWQSNVRINQDRFGLFLPLMQR